MRLIISAVTLSLLAGCAAGGSVQSAPQGIGSSPNQLRRAPCACNEIKSQPGLPAHLQDAGLKGVARA